MNQEQQIAQLVNYMGGDFLGMNGEDVGASLIGYKGLQSG